MLTYAKSLNKGLADLLEDDKSVYLIGEDICDPYGGAFKITKGLSTKYAKRVINTPISEQAITGIAIGMALRGFKPILEIMFGDFITLATDQILSNISKMRWMYNKKVSMPLVIRLPMGGRRGYGPTHSQCLEKMFLGVPGIKIVAPSIFNDVGRLIKLAVNDIDPVLFIEYKLDYSQELRIPTKHMVDDWFVKELGDNYPFLKLSATNFEDDSITVITYGGMVSLVEKALKKLLLEDEIFAEILIPTLIKPFNIEQIIPSVKKTGKVLIVEEGTKANGWGAELAATIQDNALSYLKKPIKRVAAKDLPIANTKSLEDSILPSIDDIIIAIKELV